MTAPLTDAQAAQLTVTREDAIKFLECACRNWSRVPKLSEDDIGDVATELLRFAIKRATTAEAERDALRAERDTLAESAAAFELVVSNSVKEREAAEAEAAALRKLIRDNWQGEYWRSVSHAMAAEVNSALTTNGGAEP